MVCFVKNFLERGMHCIFLEEAVILARYLKGVCLSVAAAYPNDEHAATLGSAYRSGVYAGGCAKGGCGADVAVVGLLVSLTMLFLDLVYVFNVVVSEDESLAFCESCGNETSVVLEDKSTCASHRCQPGLVAESCVPFPFGPFLISG